MKLTLTLTRVSPDIFTVQSDVAYWSDGRAISERLAFSPEGKCLSNVRAQALDGVAGNRYILVSPFAIKTPAAIEAAPKLAIGAEFVFTVNL